MAKECLSIIREESNELCQDEMLKYMEKMNEELKAKAQENPKLLKILEEQKLYLEKIKIEEEGKQSDLPATRMRAKLRQV